MSTCLRWVAELQLNMSPALTDSVADVGYMWFGPIGREIFGAIYWIFMVAVVGSSLLSIR